MKKTLLQHAIILFLLLIANFSIAQIPLVGNYTINANLPASITNFQTFNALADSLNQNGVSGDVTVTVEPGSGPYNEQVIFNNIQGTGPAATVSLEGSGETITALTDAANRHIIRLTNIQYFTINNIKILRDINATSGFYGIHIYQSGNHITLSNNEVDMNGSTSTLVGGYIASDSATSILAGGNFHNINIILNKTNTGGYGASVFGEAGNLSTNINISGNEFISFNDNGVYLRETDGAIVSGNYFDKLTTNITGWNAIQVAQALNINTQIFNNEIKVSQTNNGTMTIRGIYLFNGTGHEVYNNVIHDVNLTSGNFTGIEIRTGGTTPEIHFNTISLNHSTGTTGNLYGIKEELSNTNTILRNNIINITQTTSGIKSALVLGATAVLTTAFDSDYNWLYVPAGNIGQRGTISPTFYPTLGDWQTASNQDINSLGISPQITTVTYPVPTNLNGNDAGISIPGILIDFLSVTRSTPPDIGAIEFGGCPPNAPDQIFGDTLICENATNIVYSITPVPNATGYTWTVPSGAVITAGQNSISIVVDFGTQSGAITVTANDSCGSSIPASLIVNIESPLPAVSNLTGPGTVCENETLVLYSIDSLAGSQIYNWMVPTGSTIINGQGTTSIIVNFGSVSGNISVEAANSCGLSPSSILPININPLPIVTFNLPLDTVCQLDAITLSGGSPANGNYSGPGVSAGQFHAPIAGPGLHTLTYTFEDTNGCTDSTTDDIFVEICVGINELDINNAVSVYPNPSNKFSVIEINYNIKPLQIRIIDELGQIVKTINKPENKFRLITEEMNPGIYFIEIQTENQLRAMKKILVY